LAVGCFSRVGITNIAADGTVQFSAVMYAALTGLLGPYPAGAAAVAAGCAIGVGVAWVVERLPVSDMLFTLGVNFFLVGLSSVVCWWAFRNPGNGPLPVGSDRRIPLAVVDVTASVAVALVILAIVHLRTMRLGIVLGLSEELALAEGLPCGKIGLRHGCLGGVLLGLAGVVLAEMGGSYTRGI